MKWGRFLLIAIGMSQIGILFCMLPMINHLIQKDELLLSIFFMIMCMVGGLGAATITRAIFHWNGDPNEVLLLRLLEDRINETEGKKENPSS